MSRQAILLDRDGVLTPDLGRFVAAHEIEPFPAAKPALARLRENGWSLVVISNQPWVARGICSAEDVMASNEALGLPIDRWYFCPHHPNANLQEFRIECDCRKPRPGMIHQAARELGIDLSGSFMVGDRTSDMEAAARAGCRSILVQTGQQDAQRIISPDAPIEVFPDHVTSDIQAAVDWILKGPR